MTAAHCTEGSSTSRIQVIAGEHDLNVDMQEDQATRHNVKSITDHHSYGALPNGAPNYDFSILELVEPIDLSSASNAKAACLPTLPGDDTFTSGTKFVVSGWGALTNGGRPNVLHHVSVPWVSDNRCEQSYGNNAITPQMICAGDVNNGQIDSCQGDSGGPLTLTNSGRTKLIGVVSFGIGCGNARYPGVYAKVSSVLGWVQTTTGNCNAATDCGVAPPTPPGQTTAPPCTDSSRFCVFFARFGFCQSNFIANACRSSCNRC